MTRWVGALVFAIALGALVSGAVWRATTDGAIRTDIRDLLPSVTPASVAETVANKRLREAFVRQHFILLEGALEQNVAQAAIELRAALEGSGLYLNAFGEQPQRGFADAARFLFPYRYGLLTPAQQTALASEAGRAAFYEQALALIYTPFSGVTADLLRHDPFLVSMRLLTARAKVAGFKQMRLRGGFLTAELDGRTAILMPLRVNASPFSASMQEAMAAFFEQTDRDLATEYPGVKMIRAGVIEHAYRAAATAKSEVALIGGLSILGIVLLVVSVFRSIVPLIASLIAIAAGVVAGVSAVIVGNGSINIISLVAGTSLIGISVDYAFHYFAELRYGASAGVATRALSHIRPGVILGFLTTLIAFVGMALPPFPGLRELALFSGVGMSAAFLSLWTIFPLFPVRAAIQNHVPLPRFFKMWLCGADSIGPRRATVLLIAVMVLSAMSLALLLKPVDDVRALQPTNLDVADAEQRLAAYAGARFSSQYLLVEGTNADQVLQREEELLPALAKLTASGRLGGYTGMSQLVPSTARQRASLAAVSRLATGAPATIDRFTTELGLEETLADSFRTDIAQTQPLTPAAVVASGYFPDLADLWQGDIGNGTASIVALRTPVPVGALQALAGRYAGVRFVDPVSQIGELMGHYRSRVEWMIIGAYGVILVLLAFRYGARGAALAVLPPVVAALTALLVLTLSGQLYTVFATVGLILVLGIGIDYTLFFLESPGQAEATALAVFMSAVSTLLAFGLLAFSSTPAVHTFGLTICVGITIAFLLSPLARSGRTTVEGRTA